MRLRYQKKIGIKPKHPKTFWLHISTILVNALNFAHETGQLLITQRRGIYFIKNWRPLTLLNCDYKIAAKTIANRINRVLPALINNDQTGFLKGRFVGEKIRLIDSLICCTKEQNIPGLLLFLDFEKAFDTIEWYFIRNTLSFFGFGASVISWQTSLVVGRNVVCQIMDELVIFQHPKRDKTRFLELSQTFSHRKNKSFKKPGGLPTSLCVFIFTHQ